MRMAEHWLQLLEPEFNKRYMLDLERFLEREYRTKEIYPRKELIFRALELTDFDQVRFLILSQDPYINEHQANGLAFAVDSGQLAPPSLRNIFTEIEAQIGKRPYSTTLTGWTRQGVLLLNTVLTVEAKKSNSHKGMGWEKFTDRIISLLGEREQPTVFMLWGSSAGAKKYLIKNKHHLILESAHPSPLSAHRGFFGNNHFIKANKWLIEMGLEPICWEDSGAGI